MPAPERRVGLIEPDGDAGESAVSEAFWRRILTSGWAVASEGVPSQAARTVRDKPGAGGEQGDSLRLQKTAGRALAALEHHDRKAEQVRDVGEQAGMASDAT